MMWRSATRTLLHPHYPRVRSQQLSQHTRTVSLSPHTQHRRKKQGRSSSEPPTHASLPPPAAAQPAPSRDFNTPASRFRRRRVCPLSSPNRCRRRRRRLRPKKPQHGENGAAGAAAASHLHCRRRGRRRAAAAAAAAESEASVFPPVPAQPPLSRGA